MVAPEFVKGLNGKLVTERQRAWQYIELALIFITVIVIAAIWNWLTQH
jgi:hypothetical protein